MLRLRLLACALLVSSGAAHGQTFDTLSRAGASVTNPVVNSRGQVPVYGSANRQTGATPQSPPTQEAPDPFGRRPPSSGVNPGAPQPEVIVGGVAYICPYKTDAQCKSWGQRIAKRDGVTTPVTTRNTQATTTAIRARPDSAPAYPVQSTFGSSPQSAAVDCNAEVDSAKKAVAAGRTTMPTADTPNFMRRVMARVPAQCRWSEATHQAYEAHIRSLLRNEQAATRNAQAATHNPPQPTQPRPNVNCQGMLAEIMGGTSVSRAMYIQNVYNANCL